MFSKLAVFICYRLVQPPWLFFIASPEWKATKADCNKRHPMRCISGHFRKIERCKSWIKKNNQLYLLQDLLMFGVARQNVIVGRVRRLDNTHPAIQVTQLVQIAGLLGIFSSEPTVFTEVFSEQEYYFTTPVHRFIIIFLTIFWLFFEAYFILSHRSKLSQWLMGPFKGRSGCKVG